MELHWDGDKTGEMNKGPVDDFNHLLMLCVMLEDFLEGRNPFQVLN